jgi:putative transposase
MVQRYPTDLTETEWMVLTPLIPAAKPGGRPRTTDMREVVNAIFYILRSGCQWRMLPTDFPPHQTVYDDFQAWRRAGVWERMHDTLRGDLREASGRHREPRAGIIDSQTVKTTEKGGSVAMMGVSGRVVASDTSWSMSAVCSWSSSCILRGSRTAMGPNRS